MAITLAASLWRCLIFTHRWLGVLLCLMFVAWFGSALFIIYVKFPDLTPAEQRAGAAPLDAAAVRWSPGDAVGRLRAGDFRTVADVNVTRQIEPIDPQARLLEVSSVRLLSLLGRPAYRVAIPGRQPRMVFADDGAVLGAVTPELALRSARDFVQRAGLGDPAKLRHLEVLQADQWSISGSLHEHRPLHRLQLGDARGTELYVSSSTGQVVRDTHRTERVLNYFAAVTHWLYPTFLRRNPQRWSWTVDLLAGAGIVLAASGLGIGVARLRRRGRASEPLSPYRGLMRWHHLTGLTFGITTLTWVFSGLLSMNPANLNPEEGPTDEEALVFSGTPLIPSDFGILQTEAAEIVAAELLHYERQPFYRVTARDGTSHLQYAGEQSQPRLPDTARLISRARLLLPDSGPMDSRVLDEFDEYYYTRHQAESELPLPVLRVQFADAEHTWFYVDVQTGRIMGRSTQRNRVYRWLYNGLHSFDWKWLRERRPLWDVVVLTFCLGGLVLSVIGLIAALRRLRREIGSVGALAKASLEPG